MGSKGKRTRNYSKQKSNVNAAISFVYSLHIAMRKDIKE